MTLEMKQSVKISFTPYDTPVAELKEFLAHVPDDAKVRTSFYDSGNDPRERDMITMEAEWSIRDKAPEIPTTTRGR